MCLMSVGQAMLRFRSLATSYTSVIRSTVMHFRGQASTNMRVNVIDTRLKALTNFFDSVTVDNIELAWLVALKWFLYLLKL